MQRSGGPHLTLVVGTFLADDEGEEVSESLVAAEVAAEVAAVLAGATDEVLAVAPLTLPLALSICMQRHDAGTEELIAAMQALRQAVLAVSGLDSRSEPVPLVAGDPRVAALGLAEYLRGLLARAARACAAAPDDLASAAAAHLA